jgi:Ca2+-binding RTX toxin-like protein
MRRNADLPEGRVVRGHRFVLTTNDLPDCPKGGLLLGTDKADKLGGKEGDDEVRGLGAADQIFGGVGKDFIYGGPGDDSPLVGEKGADVIYGGDGNDYLFAKWDSGPDKLYCGKGKDEYAADKIDYVSSSCEKKAKFKVIY